MATGVVYIIGAGSSGTDSLTLRGADLLAAADAIVYDGRLLARVARRHATRGSRRIDIGRSRDRDAPPPEDVRNLLVALARDGKRVVLLTREDPFGDAAIGEVAQSLHDASVPFEIVAGVSAAGEVAASTGVPLLSPTLAQAAIVVDGDALAHTGEPVDWTAIARVNGTLVVRNARRALAAVRAGYQRAGLPVEIPALAIGGTRPAASRIVSGTLAEIEDKLPSLGRGPVTLIVGWSVLLRDDLSWRERRPLDRKRIVLARARHGSTALALGLRELGATVIMAPTLDMASLDLEPLRAAIPQLRETEWIVFSSPDAVSVFWEQLLAAGCDARALGTTRVACVGSSTAAALLDRGITVDVVQERFGADALLDRLGERSDIPGASMLYIADDATAEPFGRDLENAGAMVTSIAVYREVPRRRVSERFAAMLASHAPSLVVAMSDAAVEAYARITGEEARALVPFATTDAAGAALARSFGIDVVVEADGRTSEEFLDAIVAWFEGASASPE